VEQFEREGGLENEKYSNSNRLLQNKMQNIQN
jgi:hypothetical protein